MQEYALVAQDEARIEKYVRHGDGFWLLSEAVGLSATIEFSSVECEVYDKINFAETETNEAR